MMFMRDDIASNWGNRVHSICAYGDLDPEKLQLALDHVELEKRFRALVESLATERKATLRLLAEKPRWSVEIGITTLPHGFREVAGVATTVLKHAKAVDELMTLGLTAITPRDIGITEKVLLTSFYTAAEQCGLTTTPIEVGDEVGKQFEGDEPELIIGAKLVKMPQGFGYISIKKEGGKVVILGSDCDVEPMILPDTRVLLCYSVD